MNDDLAYGGNLEVTPPLVDAPLGRIVEGSMPPDPPDGPKPSKQTDFLIRQGVQTPLIQLDTTWLAVGHVDEFMAFAPVGPTSSWQVVWSDPLEGLALLDTVPDYEPLFYDSPGALTFVGTATGGTVDTLVDTTPGVDFTTGGPWRYIRIYDGPGAHQIGEIIGVASNSIRVGTVWGCDSPSSCA